MPKERVGEGIAEQLNSGPAIEEVKRPEWRQGELWSKLAEDWYAYALSLERKIAERESVSKAWTTLASAMIHELRNDYAPGDLPETEEACRAAVVKIQKERDTLRAQAVALAAAAGELSDWLQETGGGLDIVAFNRKANALHKALAAYRAGKEKPRATEPRD